MVEPEAAESLDEPVVVEVFDESVIGVVEVEDELDADLLWAASEEGV